VNLTSSAELAVRLVNSSAQAAGLPDPLGTVSDFRALLADRPELSDHVTAADLSALRSARAELAEIFTAGALGRDAVVAAGLNSLLARSPVHPELVRHSDHRWRMHLGRHGSVADMVIARAAFGLTLIVSRYGAERLGVCAIAACPRVFIDASPNRSRRYCAECASRSNVTTIRAQAPAREADHAAPAAS
jgi:predicted RNA-binding Zn ribbon-like protein